MSKFGISIISLFPWVNIIPWWTTNPLKKYFDFIELSPSRFISKKTIFAIKVWGFANAWNPGKLWEVMLGLWQKNILAPKLLDWIVFPNNETCQRNSQELIKKYSKDNPIFFITVHTMSDWEYYHSLGYQVILEINPGLDMTLDQILEFARDKGKIIALDLYHIRRKLRVDEMFRLRTTNSTSKLGDPYKLITELLPFTKIVHLSTNRDKGKEQEFEDFISSERKYTDFGNYLLLIKQQMKEHSLEVDFLFESIPANKADLLLFPFWHQKIITFIQKVKQILEIS